MNIDRFLNAHNEFFLSRFFDSWKADNEIEEFVDLLFKFHRFYKRREDFKCFLQSGIQQESVKTSKFVGLIIF